MSKPAFAALAAVILLSAPCAMPSPVAAAEETPAAAASVQMDASASLREYLALTDDQVTKLAPVIETRITKMDAALATAEAAEKPDVMGFVGEYGKIKKEFDAGVTAVLTPEQSTKWTAFKAQFEKDLSTAGAQKQLAALKAPLALTDEQVSKLTPAMATANQGKIDVLQKLADGGKIGLRDKLKAKNGMEAVNKTLDKSMAEVMSPDQVAGYKAAMEKKKAARKG